MAKGTVNKVMLVGRLGQDPDIRYASSGTAIAKFSLATVDRVPVGDGKYEDVTEWHRVVVFGKPAEFCGNYLSKGKLAYVEGSIRTNKWEDKDGQTRYTTEVVAREVQGMGGNGESNGGEKSNQSKPQTNKSSGGSKQQSRSHQNDDMGGFPADDDIPF